MKYSPIALFVYNRPNHTRLTIEALQKNILASQSDLFIFSDAAKSVEHVKLVDEVRKFISEIRGFNKVSIVERDRNWGLASSVIDGVSMLFEQHDKVIVLEDDLETSPYFLDYMNKALTLYEKKPKVMQISGHMFDVEVGCVEDAFFLPFITSWGWATWKDRWSLFDDSSSGYQQLVRDVSARKAFNLDDSYPYFKMLEAQVAGEIDSWAIRWNLTVFENKGLVLYPHKTLVYNLGFDGSGIHCGAEQIAQSNLTGSAISKLPDLIEVLDENKKRIFNHLKLANKSSAIKKIMGRVKQFLQ